MAELIVPGVTDSERAFVAFCPDCFAVIRCEKSELDVEGDIKCLTEGCGKHITAEEVPPGTAFITNPHTNRQISWPTK